MVVKISEEVNDLKIHAPTMLCDESFGDIPTPLPSQAFFMLVAGSAGSGKSSFLISLLSQKKPKIYRKVFENVFIIAPVHSLASVKSNIFRNHPEDKIFNELSPQNLLTIKEKVLQEAAEGFKSLLVIDDMTVYLKDKENEKLLKDLVMNRRHYHLSLVIMVQTYSAVPLPLRKTISHGVIFKPKNKREFESIFDEILFQPKTIIDDIQKFVFKKPHDFLFFNVGTNDLYHNFNKMLIQE
jgi:DNA helicase HerA-like ATPase